MPAMGWRLETGLSIWIGIVGLLALAVGGKARSVEVSTVGAVLVALVVLSLLER
ncbi:hypothetical protein ABZ490_51460 [Streptomyces sp. NPDC005811]|uniref:hypothetical protein n=1 Tax=Streptomyces sp. NPDC005811 TaxID=3154565 RepID=UPI00340DFBEE